MVVDDKRDKSAAFFYILTNQYLARLLMTSVWFVRGPFYIYNKPISYTVLSYRDGCVINQ